MYTINITHRGDDSPTTYKIFRKDEADKQDIKYVYWKDARTGDYVVSDDKYVAKCINRREYPGNRDNTNIYLRFPWGYTFFNPKYTSRN